MTQRQYKLRQIAEVFRSTLPSQEDILMQRGEYNQWNKDVEAVANAFDFGLGETMAAIRMENVVPNDSKKR